MSSSEETPIEQSIMIASDSKKDISEREKTIILGVDELFNEKEVGTITSLVPNQDRHKIVSCKNFRRETFILQGMEYNYNGYWYWFREELQSYQEYLDFLYQNNIEDVYESDIKIEEFEALVKALMIKYNLLVATHPGQASDRPSEGEEVTKLGNENYNSFIIFKSSLIRSSFDVEFLSHVKKKMQNINGAKNDPSLEMLYRYFLATPRPQMKVKTYPHD